MRQLSVAGTLFAFHMNFTSLSSHFVCRSAAQAKLFIQMRDIAKNEKGKYYGCDPKCDLEIPKPRAVYVQDYNMGTLNYGRAVDRNTAIWR